MISQHASLRRSLGLIGLMGVMLLGLPWCRAWAEPLPEAPAPSVREQPEAGMAGDLRDRDAKTAPDPRECLLLGQRYENGIGVPQDLDRALGRYCEAAHLGLAEARYHLGWLYVSGRLGKIDEVLAAAWFKAALALDHPRASQQLLRLEAMNLDLEADPACVLRDAMVARRIIDLRPPAAPSRSAEPAGSDPKSDRPHPREIGPADIIALVQRLAPDYRLDPNLVLAVIETESNFALDALSPKNAQGLMQLIPATAERFGVANVWDPVDNLRGGMAYLRWLLDHFNGDVELALAGYNAGEQAVARHGGIPPYPETQAYVKRIQRRLGAETGVKGERADPTTTEARRT